MGVSLLVGISIDYYTWETSVYVEITNFTGHHIQRLLYWESVILSVYVEIIYCHLSCISGDVYTVVLILCSSSICSPSPPH